MNYRSNVLGGGGKPSEIIQNYIILISYRVKIAGTNVYSDWTQHFGSDAQFFNNLGHCMRQADKRYALQKKQSNADKIIRILSPTMI